MQITCTDVEISTILLSIRPYKLMQRVLRCIIPMDSMCWLSRSLREGA